MMSPVQSTKQKLEELFADDLMRQVEVVAVADAPESVGLNTETPEAEASEPVVAEPQFETIGSVSITESDYAKTGYYLDIAVPPQHLLACVQTVSDEGYFIESITGVDWIKDDQIESVYDFNRYDATSCRIVVRTRCDRRNPRLPSITSIYSGANWHERETRDFFGIDFEGHPHLIPLLLPEDADFHPLLKDFKG